MLPGVEALTILGEADTHMPNLTAAFGDAAAHVAAGEALIFRPSGAGNAGLVARLPIEEWPQLAASAR